MKNVIHHLELNIDDDTIAEKLHAIEDILEHGTKEDHHEALHTVAEYLEVLDLDNSIDFGLNAMNEFGIKVTQTNWGLSLKEVIAFVDKICNNDEKGIGH